MLEQKGLIAAEIVLRVARGGGNPVPLREIAKGLHIASKTIEQYYLPSLMAAGILVPQRGCKGGYTLGSDPGDITMANIESAMLNEPLNPYEGLPAPLQCIWCDGARNAAWRVLGKYTILTLLRWKDPEADDDQ